VIALLDRLIIDTSLSTNPIGVGLGVAHRQRLLVPARGWKGSIAWPPEAGLPGDWLVDQLRPGTWSEQAD
jgi:hypothetical protein